MDTVDLLKIYSASLQTLAQALNSFRTIHNVVHEENFAFLEEELHELVRLEQLVRLKLASDCYAA